MAAGGWVVGGVGRWIVGVRGDEWWAIAVANIIAIAPMLIITILLGRMMRSGLMLGSIR